MITRYPILCRFAISAIVIPFLIYLYARSVYAIDLLHFVGFYFFVAHFCIGGLLLGIMACRKCSFEAKRKVLACMVLSSCAVMLMPTFPQWQELVLRYAVACVVCVVALFCHSRPAA